MEYTNKKIISISAAVAVLVIIIAAFSCKGVLDSYKKEQQKCEVFSTATVSQGYKVKSYPLSVAFTNGKIEQTGDIKILARRGNWCKIIYVAKGKIKEGFIKATELTNIKDGIVEASVITLSRGNFTSPVGEEVEIGAQLYPQYSNEQIEWTSSDDKIASVENGKVTINGVGTATITAKIKSNSKSIAVTGVSADSEFKFDGDEYSLNINNSLDLSKKLGGKESGEITWSSSDGNVVSVSGGKVKALKAGAVIIKATSKTEPRQAAAFMLKTQTKTLQHGLISQMLTVMFSTITLRCNILKTASAATNIGLHTHPIKAATIIGKIRILRQATI